MDKIETIIQQETRTVQDAIFYNNEVFTYFDEGLTRHVYVNDDKTKVIKILINSDSFDFNKEESDIYDRVNDDVKSQMAETKLTLGGMIIEQEFCNPIKWDDRNMTIPEMLFASSCRDEVGWNKNDELVCFDLNEFKKY